MSANTQGYKGIIAIDGVAYPCTPGASLDQPENWAVEPTIGNYWAFNKGVGLVTPILSLGILPLDHADGVLNPAFLQPFHDRTNDVAHDTTAYTNCFYFDGRDTFELSGVKPDAYSLGTMKGGGLVLNCRFCCTGYTRTAGLDGDVPLPLWDNSDLVRFNAVNFLSGWANIPWAFNLSYNNNHTPNLALDGTRFPSAWNAGMKSGGISVTVQAADGMPIDQSEGSIAVQIAGANCGVRWSIDRAVCMNPRSRTISFPRVMRQYAILPLGDGDYGYSQEPIVMEAIP